MCELVVFVEDQIGDDIYKDCQRYKRGDVVCVQPDGWTWGTLDIANPQWRIVKFPGVPVEAFSAFIMPQRPVDPLLDPKEQPKTLLRRAASLDLNAIVSGSVTIGRPVIGADQMPPVDTIPTVDTVDATVLADIHETTFKIDDVQALTITKPYVNDPTIIGIQHVNLHVIG